MGYHRLKKDYFSKPKGTVVDVEFQGNEYRIKDKQINMYFALLNGRQKEEYIEFINN